MPTTMKSLKICSGPINIVLMFSAKTAVFSIGDNTTLADIKYNLKDLKTN